MEGNLEDRRGPLEGRGAAAAACIVEDGGEPEGTSGAAAATVQVAMTGDSVDRAATTAAG